MHQALFVALVVVVASPGCDLPMKVTSAPLPAGVQPPVGPCRSAADVELHLTHPPSRPYDELALVQILGNQQSNPAQHLSSLRSRGEALCADAIVQVSHGTQGRDILFSDEPFDAPVTWGVAVRYVRDGDATHPEDSARADVLVLEAMDADAAGQAYVADELLRRALGLDRSRHEIAARLARRRAEAGDPARAIALYRLAVTAAPERAAYRRGLADALLEQGQHHEARMHYRRAARLGDREAAAFLAELESNRG